MILVPHQAVIGVDADLGFGLGALVGFPSGEGQAEAPADGLGIDLRIRDATLSHRTQKIIRTSSSLCRSR